MTKHMKQVFKIEKDLRFEVCVEFSEGWEQNFQDTIRNALEKVREEMTNNALHEITNQVNLNMREYLENNSV